MIINEVYYSFNLSDLTSAENTIAPEMVAPVINGNNAYIIEMVTPYPSMGESASFEIREFSPLNGNIGNALPISANEKSFVNNSSFHQEIISSASNGTGELYFIGATNLIIVNTNSNTATHVDLYPSFTWDNWMTFQGLEYSESLGLLATRRNSTNQFDIVQIDPQSGTFTELVTIPGNLNTEFYSTTYNECTKTFYLTTLKTSDWSADYYEINLNNNSISNTQNFSNYTYGLEVIDN